MSLVDEFDFEAVPGVLVGEAAPDFTAAAVMPDNSIVDEFTLSDVIDAIEPERAKRVRNRFSLWVENAVL